MKYRVFVEDIGPGRYSGYRDYVAASPAAAIRAAAGNDSSVQWIALPYSRRDLWPDGKTGRVTKEAIREGRKA